MYDDDNVPIIGGCWSIDDDSESYLYADYVGGDDFG